MKRNKITYILCTLLATLMLAFGFSINLTANEASAETYEGKHISATSAGYICNQVPQNATNEEISIQFDLFSFSAGSGFGWIGFATSNERYDWHDGSLQYLYAYGETNFLAYYNGVGTTAVTDAASVSLPASAIEPSINVSTLFKAGQTIKAVFNPSENTFTVMTKTIKGSSFKTVQTITVPNLPKQNATVALQFCGAVDLEVANFKMTCGENEIAYTVSTVSGAPITMTDVTLTDDATVYANYAGIVNASGETASYGYLGATLPTSACIMEMDLLDVKNTDAIAFFAGATAEDKSCDASVNATYFCRFNKDGSFVGGNGFAYGQRKYTLTGGISVRVIFDAVKGTFTLQTKAIADNSLVYETAFTAPINAGLVGGGLCGVQVISASGENTYVILDNFFVSDLDFTQTYYNDFNDQAYCDMVYRCEFGGVIYDETGEALFYADPCYDVVFMDYDGTVLSRQRVNRFNRAECVYEGERAGYDFLGWSENIDCITENITVLPVFAPKKAVCSVRLDGSKQGLLSETEYVYGETVDLIAPTYADALFKGWFAGDTLLSEEEEYSFTAETDVTVTAKYVKVAKLVCVNTQTGAVETTLVEVGSTVTVTAPAITDCTFKGFETAYTQTETEGNVLTLTMPETGVEIRCNYDYSGTPVQEYVQKDTRGATTLYVFIGVYVACLCVLTGCTVIRRKWQ